MGIEPTPVSSKAKKMRQAATSRFAVRGVQEHPNDPMSQVWEEPSHIPESGLTKCMSTITLYSEVKSAGMG
jgi:hypothetical protein